MSLNYTLSKVTAKALNDLPYHLEGAYDIKDTSHHTEARISIGEDFMAGRNKSWKGHYWSLELSTGIIHYSSSVADMRSWIKLCREVAAALQAEA